MSLVFEAPFRGCIRGTKARGFNFSGPKSANGTAFVSGAFLGSCTAYPVPMTSTAHLCSLDKRVSGCLSFRGAKPRGFRGLLEGNPILNHLASPRTQFVINGDLQNFKIRMTSQNGFDFTVSFQVPLKQPKKGTFRKRRASQMNKAPLPKVERSPA